MKIFADRNILAVEQGFARYGDLHLFDGRSLSQADLLDADALLVRSITRVDEALVGGTNIRFVGSATSGTDHIDLRYLRDKKIGFAEAKGSNANAVVDYCFAAMAYAASSKGLNFKRCTVGIVGAGMTGSLLAKKLAELNNAIRLCDPLLANAAKSGGDKTKTEYCALDEALQCDVVSLHVPLTTEGRYPTKNMIDADELELLAPGALFINTCRGEVVNEEALKRALSTRTDLTWVSDVWRGEPDIDSDLVNVVDIATPHIAGYSQEAKMGATRQLIQAFRLFFKLNPDEEHPRIQTPPLPMKAIDCSVNPQPMATVLNAFPILQLSKQFKQDVQAGLGAEAFDSLRQKLLSRQEFQSRVLAENTYTLEQLEFLLALGFKAN